MKKIIMLCVVLLTFKNYSQEVGVTEGQLSISLKGSAQYSIPIAVPPGINGVLPQISLNYDSQDANGLAGYGWSIGGISTITRISSTKYHDGINDPVDFDNLDRFAFDGQRLLLKTGTYGANGATYETENFSNHKITSYGVHPNGANYGPAYFKVQYPDGAIAYFGNSTNSRSLNQYAITYWENVQGVRISYYYNLYNNFLSVRNIKYGSRFTETAINVIDFIYKDRQRPEEFYIGGLKFSMNSILSEINIKGNMKGFKTYILEHDITTLGYERLKSITEKTGDGTKSLSPTVFDYGTTGESVVKYAETTQLLTDKLFDLGTNQTISGYFNTNSNLDFLMFRKYKDQERKDYVLFKDLSLTTGPNTGFVHSVGLFEEIFPVNYLKGNLNDGYKIAPSQGWCVVKTDSNNNTTYFSVYSAGSNPANPVDSEYTKQYIFPKQCKENNNLTKIHKDYLSGDFNGDNLTDIVAVVRGFTHRDIEFNSCQYDATPVGLGKVYFIDLDKRLTENYVHEAGNIDICYKDEYDQVSWGCRITVGDVTGDGKSDIIVLKNGYPNSTVSVYSLDNNNNVIHLWDTILPDLFKNYNSVLLDDMDYREMSAEPILTGDYNGDGKTDFIFNGTKFTSTGTSFQLSSSYRTNVNINTLMSIDFNNDGKTDLFEIKRESATGDNVTQHSLNWITNKNGSFSRTPGNCYTIMGSYNGYFGVPMLVTSPGSSKKNEIAFFKNYSIEYYQVENDFSKDKLLKSITNGYGVKESISYNNLEAICPESCFSVYVPNALVENYPNLDIVMSPTFQVVSKLEKKSASITKSQLFAYHGGVANVNGLGFLGFRSTLRTNWHNDPLKIISNVSKNDINLRGANVENYSVPNLVPLSASTPSSFISKSINWYNTYDNVNIEPVLLPNKVFKLRNTISKQYNGLENTSTEKTIIYDEYNNAKKTTINVKEGANIIQTSISDIVYENQPNGSTYFIGRPLNSAQNTTLYPNNSNLKDITSTEEIYTYSNNLLTKIMKKGHLTDYVTEENAYDVFGNIIQKTITATGLAPRIKKFEYNSATPATYGRFLTKTSELENGQEKLIQQYTYDDISGVLLSETNHLGNKTTYLYDGWFKNIKITDYLGKDTEVLYTRPILRSDKSITITKNGPDGSSVMAQYDDLGRKIKEGNKNIDGNWSYINTKYDINDKVIGVSEPYTGLAIIKWNNTSYDNYGRPSQVVTYSGKTTAFSYTGLTKTVTDDVKTVTTTRNAIGNTILLTEAGSTINYKYFANGNLKESNYDGIKTEITQDGWGRKIILKDPSSGQFEYKYNSLGELTEEKNLNGTTTFVIDDFGKTIEKTVVGTGGNTTNTKAVYTYHPDTKLITAMRFDDFTAGNFTNYSFGYDNYKRLIFNDESGFLAYYQQAIQYDEFGRPFRQLYHSESTNTGKKSIRWIKNTYKNGYQWQILDDATNTILWQTNTVNVRGQLSSAKLGNGIEVERKYDQYGFPTEIKYFKTTPATNYLTLNYSFNPVTGNLTGRTNNAFNFNEAFEYDNLDRLKNFTNAQAQTEIQNYDAKGRITANNLGVYNYTDTNKVYQNTSVTLSPEGRGYYQNREGIFNDDMESKSGWATYYYPATDVYYDNTESKTGAYSLKINNTAANSERVVGSEVWIPINNAVATEYTYSVWVKSDAPQAELFLFMKKEDEVNAFTSLSQVTTNVIGEWFLLQKTVLVPANIKMLSLRLDNNGTGNIWFDDVRIKKTSNVANALRELNISYNPFKSPIQIEETGVDKISFDYNEADNRASMFYGGLQDKMLRPLRKHYSMDGSMEIKHNIENGEIEFITYIGGDGYTAPVALKSNGLTQQYLYLLRDYQGSIVAIYDDQANVLEKRMFDAWGNVIKVLDGKGNSLSQLTVLDRGYTGHEHLQSVGLINMNGRLYDPLLHRFIQPDNNIQDPFNPQNYNRYGYVLNNPLKYTDPSGEFWGEFLAGLIYAYFGGVSANNGDFNPINWDYSSTETWSGMLFAAASAEASIAASNYVNGDFSQGRNGISPYVADAVIFTEGITSNFRQGAYDRVDDVVYFFQDQALSSDYWKNTLTSFAINRAINMTKTPEQQKEEYVKIIDNISGMSANEWAYQAGYSSPDLAVGIVAPYALEGAALRLGSVIRNSRFASGTGRAFWSVSSSETRALEAGFETLGETRAGKNLKNLTEGMPYFPAINGEPASQAYQWWARLSTQYAKGASGTVHVFQNAEAGVGLKSIWSLYEYPALLKNPKVTKIIYHVK